MIPGPDDARSLVDAVLDLSDADETEVALLGGRRLDIEFDTDGVRAHCDATSLRIRIRGAWRRRGATHVGVATTSGLQDDELRDALVAARAAALATDPAPDWLGLPHPEDYPALVSSTEPAFDALTAEVGPAWLTDFIARAVFHARRRGLRIDGGLRLHAGALQRDGAPDLVALGNSLGMRRFYRTTRLEAELTVLTDDGARGTCATAAVRRDAIDILDLMERAESRAREGLPGAPPAAGAWTVVLEPPALERLLDVARPLFSADRIDSGLSPVGDRMRPPLFPQALVLSANPSDPAIALRPFDGEGVPSAPLSLIAGGQAVDRAHSRASAVRRGIRSNGYGPIEPAEEPPLPRGLILSGGSGSVEELLGRHSDLLSIRALASAELVDSATGTVAVRTSGGIARLRSGVVESRHADLVLHGQVLRWLGASIDHSVPERVCDSLVPALVLEGIEVEEFGA